MSQYKNIKYQKEDQTALITINRPEVYNAMNADTKMEIVLAIRDANKSSEVLSIILTGEGKAFTTGQDLNDRSVQANNGGVDLGTTLETEWNPLINSIRDSKKIVIAAINGVCAGAGVSVAVACDLLVSKPNVKFVGAFSKLGLAPDAGSTYIFSRALGYQKTMEFFLMGEALMSEDLHKAGIINAINEDVLFIAKQYAQAINKLSPLSCEMIKKNIKASLDSSFTQSMERETQVQRYLGKSADYKEGLTAFLEKRSPIFTGQ
ncbi:MAG: 2-(1,2-epoxy-1,2-dihydrophenyl)acetyl-CoA isomerase [Bacteriovoracaceae bacterium]|nr:2-(1,2-epoxy-1,2-dihydrophenyl)acetyl-CoA isomerase [Bacteriovoracaceae bacterium]